MKHSILNVAYMTHLCFTSSSVQCPMKEDVFHTMGSVHQGIISLHTYINRVSFKLPTIRHKENMNCFSRHREMLLHDGTKCKRCMA
jgi:hypothetical protein